MYLKYFGLREPPFNLTPDPRFFFDSALHREAWASLFYGIKEKKGFVVLTGEVGTGKTTLIRKVLRGLEATHRSVFIFNTLLKFDELLESILRDLDIDPAPHRVAMFQQFNDFLLEQVKRGHTVSVLIDEAQNLGEDALEAVRLLSNMETDREKLLQIILIGQPELDAKLNSRALRQLKQRVSLWCRLDRLNQTDTKAYIAHRLGVVGYDGPGIFSEEALRVIWERSAGIPRLINLVCDNALITAFAMSNKVVTPDMIHEVARDLRLTAGEQGGDLSWPERKEAEQFLKKNPGTVTEIADNKSGNRGWRAEEPERMRLARGPAVEVVHNLGLKREPVIINLPRAEGGAPARSHIIKSAAVVAAPKDTKGRAGPPEEKTWPPREGLMAHRATVGPRSSFLEDMILSTAFFDKMVAALTEAMGPMAPLVIREKVAALGESLQQFPAERLVELLQAIKPEILSGGLRASFEKQMMQQVREHSMLVFQGLLRDG